MVALRGLRPVANRITEDEGNGRIDLRADPKWIARVDEQSTRLGISRTAYIKMAVSERLERDESRAVGSRD
jgi:hypothetical protein